jgi:hypothetical protein
MGAGLSMLERLTSWFRRYWWYPYHALPADPEARRLLRQGFSLLEALGRPKLGQECLLVPDTRNRSSAIHGRLLSVSAPSRDHEHGVCIIENLRSPGFPEAEELQIQAEPYGVESLKDDSTWDMDKLIYFHPILVDRCVEIAAKHQGEEQEKRGGMIHEEIWMYKIASRAEHMIEAFPDWETDEDDPIREEIERMLVYRPDLHRSTVGEIS